MNRIQFCHVIDGSNLNPLLYNSIKFSDRDKFEYTVISLEPEDGLQKQMANIGVRSFSIGYQSRKQSISALLRLFRFFRKEKTQIVQTHLFDASIIGLTAARLARVPVRIFTGHHSHETSLHRRTLLTFADGLNGRLLANHAIAPSEQMKGIFVRDLKVPAEKVAVAPHGFDLEDWKKKASERNDIRSELGIEGKIVFGAVGRLFWVKNFENLVRAFSILTSMRDDIVLLIVGGGDQSGLRELIISLGLSKKVFLTGPRTDIAAVINSFDVFVHSSLAESFGMVFIEAFALGKPIVSTSVGVAEEIIEDDANGFVAKGTDQSSLTEAMVKMLAVQNRWPEMGENGKFRSEDFEVRKTQKNCDELYFKWLKTDR
jgi:glycosyltransferase involved in cell wall biosynthesis